MWSALARGEGKGEERKVRVRELQATTGRGKKRNTKQERRGTHRSSNLSPLIVVGAAVEVQRPNVAHQGLRLAIEVVAAAL